MRRGPNLIRQCPSCQAVGRQAQQIPHAFHTLRHVECQKRRCGHHWYTIELFLGRPAGRRIRFEGQARLFANELRALSLEAATERVRTANARYLELVEAGAVLSSTAVRTCPSCGEPGRALYASNYGPFILHSYQCSDRECAERWVTGEFAMAETESDLSSLETCVLRLRQAVEAMEQARIERIERMRAATQARHRERAKLLAQLMETVRAERKATE